MKRTLFTVAVLAFLGSASAQDAAENSARNVCVEQLDQWMNLDIADDPGQEVIRRDLKKKLEACLAIGSLTQHDLAVAYNTI